jgi:hypothetical protein
VDSDGEEREKRKEGRKEGRRKGMNDRILIVLDAHDPVLLIGKGGRRGSMRLPPS